MTGTLKPLDVERETRSGKYPDGDGLYPIVKGATSKNRMPEWNVCDDVARLRPALSYI
jgi:hypothetical protein